MASHSFDIEIAERLGSVELAIIYNHIEFWIIANRKAGRAFKDGKTWMYQSREDMAEQFPYWNSDKVRRLTDKLADMGVILKENGQGGGKFGQNWYTISDAFIEGRDKSSGKASRSGQSSGKSANGFGKSARTPLKDIHIEDTEKDKSVAGEAVASSREKIEINTNDGVKEICRTQLFQKFVGTKQKWTIEEINEAWEILGAYSGIVHDWWKFIQGTVENIKKKKKASKANNPRGKHAKQKEKTCNMTIQQELEKLKNDSLAKDTSEQASPRLSLQEMLDQMNNEDF